MTLILDVRTSDTIKMRVIDCSSTGLRACMNKTEVDQDWAVIGDIISSSKIVWPSNELSLGRLVLRRVSSNDTESEFAFSTVDLQIPVNGVLSKILEVDLEHDCTSSDKEMSSDKFNLASFVENENQNIDLFDRMREFSYFHREWVNSKKYAYQNIRTASKGPRVNLSRKRKSGRSDYLVMGSNDYLGLGAHPEVVTAAKSAMDKYGFGSTGSPVTTGQTDLHLELCEKIARIHSKEATLLFNSGYAANLGIISAVTTIGDLIIADQLCHASIQDGMALSKASSRFFKHNNPEHLISILEKERENYNGCLIITEGVFSMDGDVACLDKIYSIARDYNCRIMVDQAHCFGVLGANGFGVCEKYNLLRETDIIMGTFSKICGGIGGFATGSKELIDWLRSFGRSQMFSVSLPPSTVAAVSKSLEIFTSDKTYLESLRQNIHHFLGGLEALGYRPDPNHESAVIPVVIGDEAVMGEMYQSLLEDGIICTPVVYPAVGRKNCRFRFTVMANHSKSDLDYAVACLEKAMLKVGFSFGPMDKNKKAA